MPHIIMMEHVAIWAFIGLVNRPTDIFSYWNFKKSKSVCLQKLETRKLVHIDDLSDNDNCRQ